LVKILATTAPQLTYPLCPIGRICHQLSKLLRASVFKLQHQSATSGVTPSILELLAFRDYGKIQDYAGETWLTLKQDLLQTLRDQPDWGTREAQVDIFLHEGLIDDAIKTVERDTYYDSKLVHRVMDAAVYHRPDWVIDNARKRAEPIMEQGKADRYDGAVNWLKKVKAGYIQLGQKAAWSAYRSKLEAAHGRKRKLMELIKKLN
jgi:uncharacterized Zn finger protein